MKDIGKLPERIVHLCRLFDEAIMEAMTEMGLQPEIAEMIWRQTKKGSIGMLDKFGWDKAAQFRQDVTSPGGTTEAALQVLEKGGFKEMVRAVILQENA